MVGFCITCQLFWLRIFDLTSEVSCEQLLCRPTHRSYDCYDLLFSNTPVVVACYAGIPEGGSDHCYVSATIRTEQTVPEVSFSCKIFIKSQAD